MYFILAPNTVSLWVQILWSTTAENIQSKWVAMELACPDSWQRWQNWCDVIHFLIFPSHSLFSTGKSHDAKGIIWPEVIAPYAVVIIPIAKASDQEAKDAATSLYHMLQKIEGLRDNVVCIDHQK